MIAKSQLAEEFTENPFYTTEVYIGLTDEEASTASQFK